MKLRIIAKKPLDSYLEDVVQDAVDHFAKRLHIPSTTILTIRFADLKQQLGYVDLPTITSFLTKPPRKLVISIRELDFSTNVAVLLRILAHEMVHVKQVVDGNLKVMYNGDSKDFVVFWRGNALGIWMKDVSYTEAPWEVEANSKEPDLVNSFVFEMKRL